MAGRKGLIAFCAAAAGALAAVLWIAVAPAGSSRDRALLEAARTGDNAAVTSLLAAGANPDVRFTSPRWESWTGSDVSPFEGNSALYFAAEAGHRQIVEQLLERGADVNARSAVGNTPLMASASQLNLEIVTLLLKHGADATIVNSFGKKAVHFATKRTVLPEHRPLINALARAELTARG